MTIYHFQYRFDARSLQLSGQARLGALWCAAARGHLQRCQWQARQTAGAMVWRLPMTSAARSAFCPEVMPLLQVEPPEAPSHRNGEPQHHHNGSSAGFSLGLPGGGASGRTHLATPSLQVSSEVGVVEQHHC
jgi:hypothetical protein